MQPGEMNIAIVGGGPAGLLTAILLSRAGIRSTVVERGNWPIDKACGEGIMPVGVSVLRKHGILRRIDQRRSRAFNGVRYIDKTGVTAAARFEGGPGMVVRRLALSEALHQVALEEQHVTLLGGHKLVDFQEGTAQVDLALSRVGSRQPQSLPGFTYLIGADGINSKVRRLQGMTGVTPGKQPRRMGARVHYKVRPWDDKVQVWWKDGIEAYVSPTSNGCVDFSFGWDHDSVQPGRAEAAGGLEAGLFAFFPELQRAIEGAPRLSRLQSWGPLPHRATEVLTGRVALIGDAGVFYDQITGEGLSLAFLQAELASETIMSWDTLDGRARFRDTLKGIADHYIRITDIAMFFTRHSILRGGMIRLLARSPALFSHLLQVNAENVPLIRPALRHVIQGIFRPVGTSVRYGDQWAGHLPRLQLQTGTAGGR